MNLTSGEMDVFRENYSIIADFGFEAEEFGKDGGTFVTTQYSG